MSVRFPVTVSACPCLRRYCLEEFRELSYRGVAWFSDSGSPGAELRNCTCGNILTIPIHKDLSYWMKGSVDEKHKSL